MMYGRLLHTWDQTATLWALTANCHNDPEKHPEGFSPFDIHPFRSKSEVPQQVDNSVGFWSRVNLIRSLPAESQGKALSSLMKGLKDAG
jgi:hypothetical protein